MSRVLLLTVVLVLALTALRGVERAHATNHVVINDAASGTGSLWEAIVFAGDGDIITFSSSFFATPRTISLTAALPQLMHDVIIFGPGRDKLTINGSGCAPACSIFKIVNQGGQGGPETKVTIGGMTLSGAAGPAVRIECCMNEVTLADVVITGNSNGGVYAPLGGWTKIMDSTISNNHRRGVSSEGGGIYQHGGGLWVLRSTISGNSAGKGGGIYAQSLAWSAEQSTISNNVAQYGGGVYHVDGALGVDASLRNSAVYDNRATLANGGSQLHYSLGEGSLHVENSIVAQGPTGNLPLCSANGQPATSDGTNIFSDNSCSVSSQPSDRFNIDPQLGPLAANGGPTKTHLPLAGSPALDTGADCGPTDQRGLPRPADGSSAIPGAVCDVGPVEVQPGGR